jgi:UDP-N-acetylglucosamine 4,6-dehydratase
VSTVLGPWVRGILITGGTGYLGRALANACLYQTQAERICIFSRNEYAQATMRQSIQDADKRLRWFIGDVRDKDRLRRACEGIDLIIHAAALKRVEVGEYNPREMVLTNVNGALNVIDAAIDNRVPRVIAVSTDKACAPLNAYGATKLTMEKLMLAANNTTGESGPICSVVRYGNVSGSTGSVIPTWREMIKNGAKSVPVTDPRCSRYWMRVDEAVELILWTAQEMEGGELVVPLLPAYRIGDLADAMGVAVEVIGIGAGEKLDEQMVSLLESPAFRWADPHPYIVAGGFARNIEPNVGGIKTHILSVEELRTLLEALP